MAHSLNHRGIHRSGAWHWISRPWKMDLKPVPGDRRSVRQNSDTGKRTGTDTKDKREVHDKSVEQRNRSEEQTGSVEKHRRGSLDRSIREEQRRIDDRVRADIAKYIKDAKRAVQGGVDEHHKSIREEFASYKEQLQQSDHRSTDHHREAERNITELRRSKQEYRVQIGGSISTDIKESSERVGRASVIIENGIGERESRLQGLGGSIQRVAEWFRDIGRKAIDRSKKILSLLGAEKGRPGGGMRMKR